MLRNVFVDSDGVLCPEYRATRLGSTGRKGTWNGQLGTLDAARVFHELYWFDYLFAVASTRQCSCVLQLRQ